MLAETKPYIESPLVTLRKNLTEALDQKETLTGVTFACAGAAIVTGEVLIFGGSPGFPLIAAGLALSGEVANVFFWQPKNKREIKDIRSQISKF